MMRPGRKTTRDSQDRSQRKTALALIAWRFRLHSLNKAATLRLV